MRVDDGMVILYVENRGLTPCINICYVMKFIFKYDDFFFQAEDGIRDLTVTGVQTCALPICTGKRASRAPLLDMSPDARFPVLGGFTQRRAGTARHDAVAWGYARAADALGVDIKIGRASCRERV